MKKVMLVSGLCVANMGAFAILANHVTFRFYDSASSFVQHVQVESLTNVQYAITGGGELESVTYSSGKIIIYADRNMSSSPTNWLQNLTNESGVPLYNLTNVSELNFALTLDLTFSVNGSLYSCNNIAIAQSSANDYFYNYWYFWGNQGNQMGFASLAISDNHYAPMSCLSNGSTVTLYVYPGNYYLWDPIWEKDHVFLISTTTLGSPVI